MTSGLYSQEQIVPLTEEGELLEEDNTVYYYKDIDDDLNKFLGTWIYQDTTKELIVKFYLHIHNESGGTYYDEIYAKFKYTENSVVIYNTLLDNSEITEYRIFGGTIFADSRNELSLAYFEPTDIPYKKFMTPILNLEFIPCNTLGCNPQLKWDIFWNKSKDSDVWPFKIPSHLVLTKQ
jgi:hypothetical protein